MSSPAIEVEHLVKQFKGHRALDGVDLQVPAGSVFGFLGPNGAGKTTTIRILLGLARPTSGAARILGMDCLADPTRTNREVGFLPDVPAYHPWMRADEYLRFAASLHGMDVKAQAGRLAMLLDMTGLTGVRTPIGGFSRGMKQRLGIAQAMVNAPRVLILDEPTSALDPMGRHEVLWLIDRLRGHTTVFFSTHILSDVDRVCDHVAVLAHGRVVASETSQALRARFGGTNRLLLELSERHADVPEALAGEPWLTRVERQGSGWLLGVADAPAAQHRLVRIAADQGWGITRLEPQVASLEDIFVHLVSSQGATR